MPARKPQERSCRLFEAVQTDGRTILHPEPQDWDALLARYLQRDAKERVVGDVVHEPVSTDGRFQLTMHEPIRQQFMSQLSEDNRIINLLSESSNERKRFAHSSTVIFTEHQTIFGVVKGDRSAPNHQDVREFLTASLECEKGFKWEVRPLVSPPQMDRMQSAEGINLFSTKFSTFRTLFTEDGDIDGLDQFANRMADQVGSDLELFIEVRLPRSTRGMSAARNLKAFVSRGASTTVAPGRGSKARIVAQNGDEEIVHLLEHHLAITFDIPNIGTEKARFSGLVQGLEGIRSEMNDTVATLLKG